MTEIDCSKNCKMTKLLKESKYCTKKAKVEDGEIFFGCKEKLKAATKEERNLITCMFLDMNIKEQCFKCPLECSNNKNKELEKIKKQNEKIDAILKTVNNFGITAAHARKISNVHKKNKSHSEDVLAALSLSNNLLNKGMSGKGYDISHFSYLMRHMIKKIKK